MINTKFYRVLKNIKPTVRNRFLKFCKSPFFNQNKNITHLSITIVEVLKSKSINKELLKENVYSRIYQDDYNDQKMRTLLSQALDIFEEFLVYDALRSKKLLKRNLLHESIIKYGVKELSKKSIENSEKLYDRQEIKSSNYYNSRFLFEGLKNIETENFNKKNKDGILKRSIREVELLNNFILIEKLKINARKIHWSILNKYDFENNLLEILGVNADSNFIDPIKYFILANKILINNDDDNSFKQLKQSVDNWSRILHQTEVREIFNYLLTFAIIKANNDNQNYYPEIFDLYKIGIETKALLFDDVLNVTSFRNAVLAALKTNQTNYALIFIQENQNLLLESERNNAVNFSYARIAMNSKNWREAIEYISKVDFEDKSYNFNSRLIMLNAYYELEEYEALDSLIDSYSVFLNRKKNMTFQISYLNHLRYLRKLLRLDFQPEKLKMLKKEILTNSRIINKAWLLEKIDEKLYKK